jgi:hypothetical protein
MEDLLNNARTTMSRRGSAQLVLGACAIGYNWLPPKDKDIKIKKICCHKNHRRGVLELNLFFAVQLSEIKYIL